jgi:HUS1 checkpoint protein
MKFKAKISKELLLVLHGVVSTIEKIGENAAMLLTEDSVRIAVVSESIETPRCYSEFKSSMLFSEYKIESQSDNTILFEIGLSQLSKALGSGKYSSQCQIKLVKRDNKACLCVETKANESIMSVDVLHDIPIRVLKPTEIIHYMPPDIPAPKVALDLPKNKLMKTIVDKMLKFSKHVSITAYQSGRLVLKAEHSSAVIRTYYNGLQPRYVGQMDIVRDVDNQASVKLNLRKMSAVLNLSNLMYDTASLCEYFSCSFYFF